MQKFPWIFTLLTIMFLAATAHGGEMKPPPIEPIRIEDPALIEALERAQQENLRQNDGDASISSVQGYWSRSSSGTTVYTAKQQYFVGPLMPLTYVPPQAMVSHADYHYSSTLNDWDWYFEAYLAFQHYWDGLWYMIPLPAHQGTLQNLSVYDFMAGNGALFVYMVNALVEGAPLYNPPVVNNNSVTVYYTFWPENIN